MVKDISSGNDPSNAQAGVIDQSVLERLFSIEDTALRTRLRAQIIADFIRLDRELAAAGAGSDAVPAHEVKGLAATIGAFRLAGMADRLQVIAEAGGNGSTDAQREEVRAEIAAVLAHLADDHGLRNSA